MKSLKGWLFSISIIALVVVSLVGINANASQRHHLSKENKIEFKQRKITKVSFKKYKYNLNKTKKLNIYNLNRIVNNKKNKFVFFGSIECPYCRNFSKTLKKFTNEKLRAKVYYFEVNQFDEKNLMKNKKLVKTMSYLIDKKFKLEQIPAIFAMKGNKIISHYNDSKTSLNQLNQLNKKLK
ncbi:hypothetical protein WR164_04080 [Philodulcilactobacillus myokoensis]|uniref:Bacteriocin transport accessory protein n=1 Tax=Philodulcilactobacillus myokoensis TaxID=2929573 RepID=A0A9W6AZV4_9LACO|nr:thioredoxin fold domain-containing protein [Philodulcilactobacillus myokoensis]GLB46429.1 hypothetical protein WR164_04080 [Philodulcilactobacillus myokoensis]